MDAATPADPSVSDTADAESLPPGTVEFRARVLAARSHASGAAQELCIRCKQDIRFDGFSKQVGKGFLCSFCQDDEIDRRERRLTSLRRSAVALLVAAFACLLVIGALNIAAKMAPTKGEGSKSTKK
jgi:hypothetical protein